MSSPRWSRVTRMPSRSRTRTTARASSRVSPATNRSTTRRVAGLPVTTRRSPGRRDAASRVFCRTTGPPGVGTADTSTLGTATPFEPGTDVQNPTPCSHTVVRHPELDRDNARRFVAIELGDDGGGRKEPVRDDLQELVDEVSRLLAAPATLEDADFT